MQVKEPPGTSCMVLIKIQPWCKFIADFGSLGKRVILRWEYSHVLTPLRQYV